MELSAETKAQLASVQSGLAATNLVDFAVVQAELEIPEPRPKAMPHLWKWADVKPWLARTYAGMSLEEVHRRTLAFKNPGLGGRPFAASSLFMSISMYFPGDEAGVHRHMASASRFLLEGRGGFTTVGGEKCELERGDLVITPNGQWHDHGNDGQEPIVWVNVLDIPMTEFFNAVMTEWEYYETDPASNSGEPIRRKMQSHTVPNGHSQQLFGQGGIVPRFGPERRGEGAHSPMFLYKWRDTEKALMALRDQAGSPFDGILVEYVDPLTGGSVVPTLSFSAQLLRAQPRRPKVPSAYGEAPFTACSKVAATAISAARGSVAGKRSVRGAGLVVAPPRQRIGLGRCRALFGQRHAGAQEARLLSRAGTQRCREWFGPRSCGVAALRTTPRAEA
ncbi:MAG: cupin domain-containing protein [Rhodospirillaceae bacterium]|nr:cupin domain-containing protein [Rhodospirillaceae bacterium]